MCVRACGGCVCVRLVVGELDRGEGNALALVLEHAQLDQRVNEVGLEPLVGEIDAELLKRVESKVLEAEDVEESDEALVVDRRAPAHPPGRRRRLLLAAVERLDERFEGCRIEALREGVTCRLARLRVEGDGVHGAPPLAARSQDSRRQLLRELRRTDAEQGCGVRQPAPALARDAARAVVGRRKADVADREDGGNHAHQLAPPLSPDAEQTHPCRRLAPLRCVIDAADGICPAAQVGIRGAGALQRELPPLLLVRTGQHLVEDVVAPLAGARPDDARLLEQEGLGVARDDAPRRVEEDGGPLAEAG